MPLFEVLPYTNFENINLDMILHDIKLLSEKYDELDGRMDVIEGSYSVINETIQNIQGDITNIYEQIGEIDIEALEARVDTLESQYTILHNNLNTITLRLVGDEENIEANTANITTNDMASVNRDNALSARISALERAHLHDIYNYYAEGNQCLFGSDLRNLPDACKTSDGYPAGWGNKTNRTEGQTVARSFKFVDNGMCADTSSTGYDYYQVGRYSSGLLNEGVFTVTFAVSTGGDSTPAWYSHTFQSESDIWTVANGCTVKFRNFLSWSGADTFYKTIGFQGTASDWNTFLNGKYIVFIYVEVGTGSVAHESTDKCRFDIKDRLFFTEMPTPTIPSPILKSQTVVGMVTEGWELPAYYIDEVGEQVNYYLPLQRCNIYLWLDSSRHIFMGYFVVRIRDTDSSQQATQLAGLTEKGCYVDTMLTIPAGDIGSLSASALSTADMSTLDIAKNVNIAGSLALTGSALNKIHIRIQSSGFSFLATGGSLGSFQLFGYSATPIS